MKLQNLTVIFIIIIIPVILLVSLYISTGLKTIKYQSLYDTGLLTATHDAIYAFELNTTNDAYSDNAETKRNILKSSVKMFEKSLANTCGISAYNTDEIEEYIPVIVFGMYDGFYMYAPSYNSKTGKYEHSLKNYVYYSETLDDGTVITYSLDNYVTVVGKFKNSEGIDEYQKKEGYLMDIYDPNVTKADGTKYKGIAIDTDDTDAINYYKDAYYFTNWFLNTAKIQNKKKNLRSCDYLNINSLNNPEDENSAFVQHKREIMKNKIESVLNSSITAYSERTWNRTYKMPKLSEEDWQKIYSNISMIAFFQGKNIGLTKYNGYCVLNSTNSNEYVNPNLMYFIDDSNEYHDIRCEKRKDAAKLIGYKIGDFQKIKLSKALDENGNPIKDENGNQLYDNDGTKTTDPYKYKRMELACYDCVNGSLSTNKSIYNYIEPNSGTATAPIKTSYWTSLARERYNQTKLFSSTQISNTNELNIEVIWDNIENDNIPAEITLQILKNGENFEKGNITIRKENNWKVTIDNLSKDDIFTLNRENLPKIEGCVISEIIDEENTFKITYTSCSHNWNSYEEYHECTKCGYTCTHSWDWDGSYHKCKVCGNEDSHNWDNGRCTVCGYTCTHSWDDSSPWNHTCSYCGKQESHDSYEGCSVCGYTCTHSWYNSSPWNHTCSYCGKQESHDSYEGCSVCGYHSHSWDWDGSYHKCKVCGNKDSHNWDNGRCTVCGYTCSHNWVHPYPGTMICTICGEIVR